ncbi:MAG TPA: TIGR02646 family protein [Pyrinomonadaceae bacterium]|nr:TIGR02646 family protein [Pyrinomonadaceae bacterium]
MMKIKRLPAPDFLNEKAENWGIRYEQRRNQNSNALFSWTTHNGTRINQILLPILMEMTQSHCSFCDGYPVETVSSNSIEHFRPKTVFPRLAYTWENLFYCCSKCQESKLEKFAETLLKPDEIAYSFEYFFQYDTLTGDIIPNPDRDENELLSANKTIELYGLNFHGRPQARKRTIRQYLDSNNPILDEFPYRFVLVLIN